MSESIYYQNRHLLADALVDSLSVLGMHPDDNGNSRGVILPDDEPLPILPPESVEEVGDFFTSEGMPYVRKLAVARVAAVVATRHVISRSDLANVSGMSSYMLGYATGFLGNKLNHYYNEYLPKPQHQIIEFLRGKSTTKRYFGSTNLLLSMVESAEEKYPILHEALQEYAP